MPSVLPTLPRWLEQCPARRETRDRMLRARARQRPGNLNFESFLTAPHSLIDHTKGQFRTRPASIVTFGEPAGLFLVDTSTYLTHSASRSHIINKASRPRGTLQKLEAGLHPCEPCLLPLDARASLGFCWGVCWILATLGASAPPQLPGPGKIPICRESTVQPFRALTACASRSRSESVLSFRASTSSACPKPRFERAPLGRAPFERAPLERENSV